MSKNNTHVDKPFWMKRKVNQDRERESKDSKLDLDAIGKNMDEPQFTRKWYLHIMLLFFGL